MRRTARSKYSNVRTTVDGIRFASKREAKRYAELKLLEKAGKISNLALQVRYPLTVNGHQVATYVSDFDYREGGLLVVSDCKGMRTPMYKLKKRLMYAIHGIVIQETE